MMEASKIIRAIFTRDKVICRIIAAWASFVAFSLLGGGDFYLLEFAQDTSIALMLGAIAGMFALFSVVAYFFRDYESDSIILFAFATICVFCWLVGYSGESNSALMMLAVAAAYLIFTLYFLHKNEQLISKIRLGDKAVWGIAVAIALVSCTVISVITVLRYKVFFAPNFDFGIFCNMFYNMKESGLPLSTSERDILLSHFAVHISPIYYLILPFYCLFPHPETLQIAQAVILMSAVAPVVLLCRHFALSEKKTVAVSVIFALYPAISCGTFYDIHENCFLLPLLLWVFYFFEKEKYIPMYAFAVLVLLVKEDAAVYIMMFAVYLLLSRKKYLHGALLAAISAAYFALALYILSTFGTGVMVNRFDNLIFNSGDGLMGAVKTAILNPGFLLTQLFTTADAGYGKLIYFITLLLPLGFIPFCTKKISRYILIAPILMNMLTYYQYQYDINFQYQFGISAFLIYAVILNLPEISQKAGKYLLTVGVVCVVCSYLITVVPTFNYYTRIYDDGKETYAEIEEILDSIPQDASLCVSTFFLPHVADRDIVYEITYHGDKADVDYVVFDIRYGLSSADINSKRAYLAGGYEIEREYEGKVLILRRANVAEE